MIIGMSAGVKTNVGGSHGSKSVQTKVAVVVAPETGAVPNIVNV